MGHEPRTYVEERYWIAGSQDGPGVAALKAQAKSEGAELGPPWLPSDEGVLYGTVITTTRPRYRRPRPARPEPGAANWAAMWVALGLTLTGALTLGVVAHG